MSDEYLTPAATAVVELMKNLNPADPHYWGAMARYASVIVALKGEIASSPQAVARPIRKPTTYAVTLDRLPTVGEMRVHGQETYWWFEGLNFNRPVICRINITCHVTEGDRLLFSFFDNGIPAIQGDHFPLDKPVRFVGPIPPPFQDKKIDPYLTAEELWDVIPPSKKVRRPVNLDTRYLHYFVGITDPELTEEEKKQKTPTIYWFNPVSGLINMWSGQLWVPAPPDVPKMAFHSSTRMCAGIIED